MKKNNLSHLHISFLCCLLLITMFFVSNANAYGPLLKRSDLVYEGAFRVPKGQLGDNSTEYDRFAYGGSAIAFNPSRNSLFMVGHPYGNRLVEISIPQIINSNDINKLKTAEVIQPAVDITEGHLNNLALDGSPLTHPVPGGFLVYNNRLIGSAFVYFDAAYKGYRSHFYASLNWSQEGPNFHGMYIVGTDEHANGGFVGGYMALIPPEWQSVLGGPALTGLGGVPIISRSSYGPCAWVFNPDDLGGKEPVPATMLVGYPQEHETLGKWGSSYKSLYYNMATEIRGLVFPFGTSSVLFFGRHGLGETGQGDSCYGIGTSDKVQAQQDHYCYDPVNSYKGTHAYPYVYHVWAYDAHDLALVKKGEINPWDVKPYAIWHLTFPFAVDNAHILGAAYDPNTHRIFISEYGGERTPYEPYPLVHVFKVNVSDQPPANHAPVIATFTAVPNPADNPLRKINFTIHASDPDGDTLNYLTDFGDGTSSSDVGKVTHVYSTKGAYTVKVTVSDGQGNIAAKSLQIIVYDYKPAKVKEVKSVKINNLN